MQKIMIYKNQKMYLWKFFLVVCSFFGLIYAYVMIYSEELGVYSVDNDIIGFMFGYQLYTDPLYFIFLGVFFTSLFTFFISDRIFKRWLIFTSVWIIVTTIFITLAPISARDYFNLGPTKELVSVWMSGLFVIISILMFIIMSVRARR